VESNVKMEVGQEVPPRKLRSSGRGVGGIGRKLEGHHDILSDGNLNLFRGFQIIKKQL
jgi:hypothetical protein